MRRLAVLTATALLCAVVPAAHARPGDLDRSFSKDGKLGFNPYKLGGTTRGLVLLDGRRPLLSVQAQRATDVGPTWVSISAAGRITGRALIPPPVAFAPKLADGHALTEYRHDATAARYGLSRIGALESVPLTLEPDARVGGFGVDAQGRAVLGGTLDDRAAIWRFLPDGTRDRSYSGDGRVDLVNFSHASDIVVKRDGRVVVIDGVGMTALDATGKRLAGFHHGRVLPPRRNRSQYARVTTLVSAPGGRFLVIGGGDYGERAWIARLRPDGRRDTRWGDQGYVAGDAVLSNASLSTATVDRRGRVLLAGSYLRRSYGFTALALRLTARGRPDRTFATRGRKRFTLANVAGVDIDSSDIQHLAVDDRGRIVAAGNVYDTDYIDREDYGNPYPAIARLRG